MTQRLFANTLVLRLAAAVCGVVMSAHLAAQTPLPPGSQLYVLETGTIRVQFTDGGSALFNNELHLDSPTAVSAVFHNHTSAPGTIVDLGPFAAGAELVFRDRVTHPRIGTRDYVIGPGSRNPDALPHALITALTNDEIATFERALKLAPNTLIRGTGTNPVYLVGFEDIDLLGDQDFNDMRFLVNNVTAVPEPSQALLLLAGLGVIGSIARLRNRAAHS